MSPRRVSSLMKWRLRKLSRLPRWRRDSIPRLRSRLKSRPIRETRNSSGRGKKPTSRKSGNRTPQSRPAPCSRSPIRARSRPRLHQPSLPYPPNQKKPTRRTTARCRSPRGLRRASGCWSVPAPPRCWWPPRQAPSCSAREIRTAGRPPYPIRNPREASRRRRAVPMSANSCPQRDRWLMTGEMRELRKPR